MIRNFLLISLAFFVCPVTQAEELRVLTWNVESGGNRASTIATQISELQEDFGPFDVIGLTEVQLANAETYAQAFGDSYGFVVSNTGGGDRMVIVFNAERVELKESRELNSHDGFDLNDRNRFRSPLMAEFQEKNGTRRFIFMVNHLARGNSSVRTEQAQGLREWGRDQVLPVINCGDFNFDANFDSEDDKEVDGNAAFDEFFRRDVWTWVRPIKLIDTNHSGNGDVDTFPNSILDFICVANQPDGWSTKVSEVIVRSGDFPDDRTTSDHRPVMAAFESEDEIIDVNDILSRVRRIRRELDELERLLEGR